MALTEILSYKDFVAEDTHLAAWWWDYVRCNRAARTRGGARCAECFGKEPAAELRRAWQSLAKQVVV